MKTFLCILAGLLAIASLSDCGNDREQRVDNQVDSIIYTAASGKLSNLAQARGFLVTDVNINSAPYLIGSLHDLKTEQNGILTLTPVGDFNYLKSKDNITTKFIDAAPEFDAYIKQNFKGAIGGKHVAELNGGVSTNEVMHIRYGSIYSAVGMAEFINWLKIENDNKKYNFKGRFSRLVIVTGIEVKKLEYKKYNKTEASAKVMATSIVNVSGEYYYESTNEANVFELYVTTTDVQFMQNKIDTMATVIPDARLKYIPKKLDVIALVK